MSALEAARRIKKHFPNAMKIGDTVRLQAMAPDAVVVAFAYIKACEGITDALTDLNYLGHGGDAIGCDQCDIAKKLRAALSCSAPPSEK